MKDRILYVCHNHPSISPGGAETYALELYQAMRHSKTFEPILLCRTGFPYTDQESTHRGTVLSTVNGDPNQYLFHTDFTDFDPLMLTTRGKQLCTRFFREFLEAYRPVVVHFQHTLFLGFDFLLETRNTLPHAPIVYTLHEYLPICHRNGQMLKTVSNEPCYEATPRQCHTCFPDIPAQSFFMRKQFIASHLARVDVFLAPSRFLLERYVNWGIPREKIKFEEYGRLAASEVLEPRPSAARNRFGFFGQLILFKGVNVLLEAMKLVADRQRRSEPTSPKTVPHLWVHGANLELQHADFQAKFRRLLADTEESVTFVGRYDPARVPRLMQNIDWVVVPSIWWENSPLVIQEAFAHGKPVICSDIGAMAEKVRDGVDGLHFRANDPASLADVIYRAATTPGLWDKLRSGIPDVHGMPAHTSALEQLYKSLMRECFT